ncbi:LysR family transcriptional regulator, partial [Klebsiella grimontii]|uniref:LysR family transcriptional regulator n=1 Tax=Klebsiella grimontii TaxID=2058152 RepID=UPI00210CB88F
MDYRQLHAFVVLAQELHFGRAAQRLNVTQPALTQQIKNLENTLGLMLFVRDRRNVSLTTEGLFLIDEARVILGHCDKFLENVNSLLLGVSSMGRCNAILNQGGRCYETKNS